MARFNNIIEKWADFSDSEIKPLFWLFLGPLLVMLTLTLGHFSNPILPLTIVTGIVLSWRYSMNGFALSLMATALYFVAFYFFGPENAFLLELGWGVSLTLGLTISYLTMEELKSHYHRKKAISEKTVNELQLSLHSLEEKANFERRTLEKEVEALKEELLSSREEKEALLGLVETSRIESDKIYKQSTTLLNESPTMQRTIETLKIKLEEEVLRLSEIDKNHEELTKIAATRLKELNSCRVELYQANLLNESYQNQLKRAREYFLAQKKKEVKKEPIAVQVDQNDQLALQTLEKDKGSIKQNYDKILDEYQMLKTALEEGQLKLKKAPKEELILEVQKLNNEVKEKKKKLEHTKAELIGIEREIFSLKKGLQEKGAFAS